MITIIINDYYIINYYYLHRRLLFISMIANDCCPHRRLLPTDDCHRLLRLPKIAVIIDDCQRLLSHRRMLTIAAPATITAPIDDYYPLDDYCAINDCQRLLPPPMIAAIVDKHYHSLRLLPLSVIAV